MGLLGGCLWIPGFPPDRAQPEPDGPSDNRRVTHCTPHVGESRPVLLGSQTGEREFRCRVRPDQDVIWRLRFDGPAVDGYDLASGVPSIRLAREDLPHHPAPYRAELDLIARREGDTNTKTWHLVVLPDVASALPGAP